MELAEVLILVNLLWMGINGDIHTETIRQIGSCAKVEKSLETRFQTEIRLKKIKGARYTCTRIWEL